MPAGVALGGIYAAVRTLLLADAALAPLLAPDVRDPDIPAIYPEGAVPAGAARPYLTMGAGTQVPSHRMGDPDDPRYGWDCTIQLKAVGHAQGEEQNVMILDAVGLALRDGTELTVQAGGSPGVPYSTAWCDDWIVQPTIITIDGGITIRETPAILRVKAYD